MHIMIHPDDDVYNVPPVMISSSAADWISHHGAGQHVHAFTPRGSRQAHQRQKQHRNVEALHGSRR